ncbi:MAG: 30S ribosomal protein S3 [Candidatus Peribacteraceae bacterium]|nr:30S ribosomal protein S3 [Candidatus Peribacteraceae bacterium]
MGQKVNANGFRLGITHTWPSTWFAKGNKYRDLFLQDVRVKRYIMEKIKESGISSVEIDRGKKVTVTIHTSKPGVLIGKQGAAIEDMRKDLERRFGGSFEVEVREIRSPDADAAVIAENIQGQIQRRMPYRRAVKMAMEKAMQAGALGIKVTVSGRLNGAEIARDELFKTGNIPLQTLRANIQHSKRHAITKFGTIGVQVWIYKGMVFKKIQQAQSAALSSQAQAAAQAA